MRAPHLALLLVLAPSCYAAHERETDSALDSPTCACVAQTTPEACALEPGCGWIWGDGCGEPPEPAITRGVCAPVRACAEGPSRACEDGRCQAFWSDECAHGPLPHCRSCGGLVLRCVPECFPTE